MSLFSRETVLNRANNVLARNSLFKAALNEDTGVRQVLKSYAEAYNQAKTYNIFLSHSYEDRKAIVGLKSILEDYGYTVYVDWIEDADLDRSTVSAPTASRIRTRLKSCKCLLYATSRNAARSK